jgi:hypothetical protein
MTASLDWAGHGQASPNLRSFRWRLNSREYRTTHTRVWIDVQKLDAMLPLASKMHHVGFAGKNGIYGKYAGVDEFVRSSPGTTLYMPQARIEAADQKHPNQSIVYIFNGRHRFAWMRDHGARALPVEVLNSEAKEVARLIGTKNSSCLATMHHIPEWEPPWQPNF